MIRAATLACLLAACTPQLAAQAVGPSVELRSLLPGMPVANLGPVGEPFALERQGDLTLTSYPRPFGQGMEVIYRGAEILVLRFDLGLQRQAARTEHGGLVLGRSTIGDLRAVAGSDGFGYGAVRISPDMPASLWVVSYAVPEDDTDAGLIITLSFQPEGQNTATPEETGSLADAPQDAVLTSVRFHNPEAIAGVETLPGFATSIPPDAIPLALPLGEAFDPFDLSQ